MPIREPAVAGMFYPSDAAVLKEQIEASFLGPGGTGSLPVVNPGGPRNIVGLVSPHAGYIYSGSVAAWAYYRLAEDGLPEVVVLIGPNHRSYYPAVALTDEKAWRTPLGDISLDTSMAAGIASAYRPAVIEPIAHRAEHSLEVQVPFLQYIAGNKIKIVPILIGAIAGSTPDGEVGFARELGVVIAEQLRGRNAVVIASTDFSHYESSESSQQKDTRAISSILALDEEDLLCTVASMGISMCGVLPTAVTIAACKKLGAISARELVYRNSGDVTGDYSEVVGYAALELFK